MNFQDTLKYCLSKKGAYEDLPFGPDPIVIKVAGKMFALTSEKSGVPFLSLKCDPFLAQSLRQQYPSVKPGYHLNKEHWNSLTLDGTINDDEIRWMIDHSYELVVKSLTKAERAKLQE